MKCWQVCNPDSSVLAMKLLQSCAKPFDVIIFCTGFQIEFKDRFEESVLSDILQSIPENTPSDELCPWLAEDLIPYTLRILPESVSLLASWLEQRARNMEILEKVGLNDQYLLWNLPT